MEHVSGKAQSHAGGLLSYRSHAVGSYADGSHTDGSHSDRSHADPEGGRGNELLPSAEDKIYIPETQDGCLKRKHDKYL